MKRHFVKSIFGHKVYVPSTAHPLPLPLARPAAAAAEAKTEAKDKGTPAKRTRKSK